jgi:membrane-bound lytic murein transglycosylase D
MIVLAKIKEMAYRVSSFRNVAIATACVFATAFVMKVFSFAGEENNSGYKDYFSSTYRVFGLNLPHDLNFAGEPVPQTDFSVRESVDREFLTSTYWQSNMILLIKRANRWFPVIEPILKRHGVPDDIKYIALAESHLSNAISPQKAVGFWQLIEPTAKNYGLEISDEVDERYSVEKSTEAACLYFKEAYRKFGNWTLAAASYNLGMGGIEMQLKKQKVSSYYDLYLNEETGRYVYRVIALKSILQNPKTYGIVLRKLDLYHKVPTVTFKVDSSINNLVDFSIALGYNYKLLKIFNPWLRKAQLSNPEKKSYAILFPKKEYMEKNFDEIENDVLKDALKLDTGKLFNARDTAGVDRRKKVSGIIHTVSKGETWEGISKKYNVTIEQILMWNMLDEKTDLAEGTEFVVFPDQPVTDHKPDTVKDKTKRRN